MGSHLQQVWQNSWSYAYLFPTCSSFNKSLGFGLYLSAIMFVWFLVWDCLLRSGFLLGQYPFSFSSGGSIDPWNLLVFSWHNSLSMSLCSLVSWYLLSLDAKCLFDSLCYQQSIEELLYPQDRKIDPFVAYLDSVCYEHKRTTRFDYRPLRTELASSVFQCF